MTHPIVILHGWGLSAATYLSLSQVFRKKKFRVFVPDFPGFDSVHIPKKPYGLNDYAQFLHAYKAEHKISQPVLIGHSFGGRVALRYQELYPERVHAMILTGTPGFTPVPRRRLMLFITLAKIGGIFFSYPLLNRVKNRVRLWYYYLVGARDYYRAEGVMRDTFKNIVSESLDSSMEAVRIPTLLVWGAKDIIVPVGIAHRMKNVIRGSKLIVLPNSGHSIPFTHSKEFASVILPWIEQL